MKKADIIYTCATTLNQYEIGIHSTHIEHCALCQLGEKLAIKELGLEEGKVGDNRCSFCIMRVFNFHKCYRMVPCFKRDCFPVHQLDMYSDNPNWVLCHEKSLCVIEFYRRLLPWLRELSEEEINSDEVLSHMKEIDKHVFLEFSSKEE